MQAASTDTDDASLGPYATRTERALALRLGMWVFLASELLLFAGLFALYAGYYAEYTSTFRRAVGYNEGWIGATNTALLLISSFLVAFANLSLSRGVVRSAIRSLALAWLLGASFLTLKGLEYTEHLARGIAPGRAYAFAELRQPGASLFFSLYYLMTGLHALHMLAGLAALAWITVRICARPSAPDHIIRLELVGLYWHLVDVVWIFLWPILYLIH